MRENPSMQRAALLMEQNNFERAEKELKSVLLEWPDNEEALVLLALCKYNVNLYKEALEIINRALAINPNNDFSIYVLALIYFALNKNDSAKIKIEEAIQLNPFNADYFGLLAKINLFNRDFIEAKNFADEGLKIDPENLNCLNIRSTSLSKLGDKEGAYNTISTALEQDPNNAYTHANHGFILLEKREYNNALSHFKEALKCDPMSEYAKAGLLETLKAKFWVYRGFLQYSFWLGNLKGKTRWAIIIGFYFLFNVLKNVARSNEDLQPYLIPILILMFMFAFSSWFISPFHDLLLFLNPYGKYALSKTEKNIARLVGSLLLFSIIAVVAHLFLDYTFLLALAGFSLLILVPVGTMYNGNTTKSNRILTTYTVIIAILGLLAVGKSIENGILFNLMTLVFIVAIVLYQWVANYIIIKYN